jgi:hypothetical protein
MRAPANVTELLWQVSQGAVVMTWFEGLPAAATPSWQVAQPLTRPTWLGFVEVLNVLDVPDSVWVFGDFDGLMFGGAVVVAGGVAVVLVVFAVAAGACGVLGGNIPPLNVTVLK